MPSRFDFRYSLDCEVSGGFPIDPASGYAALFDAELEVYSDGAGTVPVTNGQMVQNWKSAGGAFGAIEMKAVGGYGVPTWQASSGISGAPVVRSVAATFDLLQQSPTDATIFYGGIFNVSQGTVFCVVQRPVLGAAAAAAWGDSGGYILQDYYEVTGTPQATAQLRSGGVPVAAAVNLATPTAPHILCYHFEGGVLYQGVDEVRTASMTGTPCGNLDAGGASFVICGAAGPGRYLDGDLAYLIFYPTALNESARKTTGRYLSGRYSIPVPF